MVGLTDGLFASPSVAVEPAKKTDFAVPAHLPTDYAPPAYRSFRGRPRIALDIETLDPDLRQRGPAVYRAEGKVVGIAIAYAADDAVYYPIGHETGPNVPDAEAVLAELRRDAADFRGELVGANLLYDLDWLRARHQIVFPLAKIHDVQLAEPLIDENRRTYRLDSLAREYLGVTKTTDTLTRLYGPAYIAHMHLVHPQHAGEYAEDDATLAWRVLDAQTPKLAADGLAELYDLECALLPLLLDMRHHGVRIDVAAAETAERQIVAERDALVRQISAAAGREIGIWAADSVAAAFDAASVPYPRTPTGRPSFTRDFLATHASPLARQIAHARVADKIAGTFLRGHLLGSVVDGRIHGQFHPLRSDDGGTVTGRFSSSQPNMQNIPARHDVYGPLLRSMFVPEDGMQWGSLDWSQIEYRLLVHYAHRTRGIAADDAVAAYRDVASTDFHALAAEITGVSRQEAKHINFGIAYGMGVPRLASILGLSEAAAERMLGVFHARAPFVRGLYASCSRRAAQAGVIRTLLGRRRRFRDYEVTWPGSRQYVPEDELARARREHPGARVRRAGTHKALNALLQGSAADIMKLAMRQMWDAGVFQVVVPHLTVHDELGVSVPDTAEGAEAFAEMRRIMETCVALEVPLRADGALGANWHDAK